MKYTIEEKIDLTVNWIRETVKGSGTDGVLVGLSGGIDSSVVACLLKKAFPQNSLGVILPCKSNSRDAADAEALAKACGIEFFTVELSEPHDLLHNNIQARLEGKAVKNTRLADANLRARLRMTTLYGIANSLNYLVAGTDNAAEIYTGYFTKYGDGGVDIIPICNLQKREVFQWAKVLGVPQQIIEREPTAGLWEGQTDESEMGTTYNMIDDHLEGKVIPDKDREIIERLHRVSAHKRTMPPGPPVF